MTDSQNSDDNVVTSIPKSSTNNNSNAFTKNEQSYNSKIVSDNQSNDTLITWTTNGNNNQAESSMNL